MSYLDQVNLSSYTLDLGIERRDQLWQVSGQLLYVFSVDGEIYVKVNDQNSALIDLRIARIIRIPFERLYITNPAQTGKNCVIVISNILTIPEPIDFFKLGTNDVDNTFVSVENSKITLTDTVKAELAKAHTQNTDTALAPLTANINANSYKITNLGVPTSIGDSIRATSIITEANLEDAINKRHTQNTDTALAPLTANINANSYKITNLGVPTSIGDSIRATSIITEANLEDAINKRHTQNTDTALAPLTANINANSYKITNLGVPTSIGDSIRATSIITEANLEDAINKRHTQNTDQYLDYGGANQSSASDVKATIGRVNQDLKTTASPTFARLSVNTTLTVGSANAISGQIMIAPPNTESWFWIDNDGNNYLRFSNGATPGGNPVIITNDGNVGIGTTTLSTNTKLGILGNGVSIGSPDTNTDASLHIKASYGGFNRYIQIQPLLDAAHPALNLIASTNATPAFQWWVWGVDTDNKWKINAGTTFATGFTIDSASNVGIGTSSPTAKLHISSNVIRLDTSKTPSSATDIGNQGDICWDSNYIYVCVATNTWKRVAIASW